MNKKLALVASALIAISSAHAENKLFPTDILDKGQADASASIQYEKLSTGLNFSGIKGKQSETYTGESIGARYGLGQNWQIGAGTSYVSRDDIKTKWSDGERFTNNDGEGKNNPYLSVSYGIVNESTTPLSLAAGVAVSPNTTGTTSSYSARLAAGWKKSETLKFYSTIGTVMYDSHNYMDNFSIQIGAYKDLSNGITIIPYAAYRRLNGSDRVDSVNGYIIGLAAHIQLRKNTYLTSGVANYGYSSTDRKDIPLHFDSTNDGLLINLGLYHLF